jgi:hypothetical protein
MKVRMEIDSEVLAMLIGALKKVDPFNFFTKGIQDQLERAIEEIKVIEQRPMTERERNQQINNLPLDANVNFVERKTPEVKTFGNNIKPPECQMLLNNKNNKCV